MFEIIDNNDVIHSGCEDEMRNAFDIMTNPDEHSKDEVETWNCDWSGDLKLIKVLEVSR